MNDDWKASGTATSSLLHVASVGSRLRARMEGFSASADWAGLLPSVGSHVRHQKELSARGFAAVTSLAAFLPRVHSPMHCPVTAPDEGPPTVTAFIQLLPSVHPLGYRQDSR